MPETDTIPHESIPEGAIPQDPREPMTHNQIMAAQLKFKGYTYLEMSEFLRVPENTIKGWFRRGTPTYGSYWRFCREMSHQASKEALMSLQSQLGTAISTVNALMVDPTAPHSIRLRAAIYVIDTIAPAVNAEQAKRDNFLGELGEIGFKYSIKDPDKLESVLKGLEEAEDYM